MAYAYSGDVTLTGGIKANGSFKLMKATDIVISDDNKNATVADALSGLTLNGTESTVKTYIDSQVNTEKDRINGIVGTNDTTSGTVRYRVKTLEDAVGSGTGGTSLTGRVTTLETSLGANDNSGVRKRVADLETAATAASTAIGTAASEAIANDAEATAIAAGNLYSRVKRLENIDGRPSDTITETDIQTDSAIDLTKLKDKSSLGRLNRLEERDKELREYIIGGSATGITQQISDMSADITALESKVGDWTGSNTPAALPRIETLESTVNNTTTGLPGHETRLTQVETKQTGLEGGLITTATVLTASATDAEKKKIYIYTGTDETTWTKGHVYYWNGTSWVDNGAAGGTTVSSSLVVGSNTYTNGYINDGTNNTADASVVASGTAADAGLTGAALSKLSSDLVNLGISTDEEFGRFSDNLENIFTSKIYKTSGKYVNAQNQFSNYSQTVACFYTDLIPCRPGDKFYYRSRTEGNCAYVIWFDEDSNIISASSQYYSNPTIRILCEAPERTRFVKFSALYSQSYIDSLNLEEGEELEYIFNISKAIDNYNFGVGLDDTLKSLQDDMLVNLYGVTNKSNSLINFNILYDLLYNQIELDDDIKLNNAVIFANNRYLLVNIANIGRSINDDLSVISSALNTLNIYKINCDINYLYANSDVTSYDNTYIQYLSIHLVNKQTGIIEKYYRNKESDSNIPHIPYTESEAINCALYDIYITTSNINLIKNLTFIQIKNKLQNYALLSDIDENDPVDKNSVYYDIGPYILLDENDENYITKAYDGLYYNNNVYRDYGHSAKSLYVYIEEDSYIYVTSSIVDTANRAISVYSGNHLGDDAQIPSNSTDFILSLRNNPNEENEVNLPRKNSKLFVEGGSTIVYSAYGSIDFPAYIAIIPNNIHRFKENIAFSKFQENILDNKISSTINNNPILNTVVKTNLITYNSNAFHIYNACNVGYIDVVFEHILDNNINADNWKVSHINAVDNSKQFLTNITISGEIEMALHLKNRPDYIGGSAHGGEVLIDSNSLDVFIDGKRITDFATINDAKWHQIVIREATNCYDPLDEVTIVAKHYKEYIFESNKLTLNQQVHWLGEYELTDTYMCMWTPKKTPVTDTIYTDENPIPIKLTLNDNGRLTNGISSKARDITIYGADSGILTKVSTPIYNYLPHVTTLFNLRDNNSGANGYNKCYWYYATGGDVTSAGDIWKTQTVFEYYYNI